MTRKSLLPISLMLIVTMMSVGVMLLPAGAQEAEMPVVH
jgi:hypothetical protein